MEAFTPPRKRTHSSVRVVSTGRGCSPHLCLASGTTKICLLYSGAESV